MDNMYKIKSKTFYKDNKYFFYYCSCCNSFYVKTKSNCFQIYPNNLQSFVSFIYSMIEENNYKYLKNIFNTTIKEIFISEKDKLNGIEELLSIQKDEIYEIAEIFRANFIEMKKLILEINYQENIYK